MSNHETLKESIKRATTDSGFRAHLLANAKYTRSFCGWILVIFGALGLWELGDELWRNSPWLSRGLVLDLFCFAINLLVYDKFSDRVAVLGAIDKVSNQSTDPTLASGTPAAAQPARLP
jgi:hypothetical protein